MRPLHGNEARSGDRGITGQNIEVIAVALAAGAFLSTMAGGLFAMRYRDRLHLLLSFSAGVVLGVVAFDVLPEIVGLSARLGLNLSVTMAAVLAGYLLFHGSERALAIRLAMPQRQAINNGSQMGLVSALAIVGHSALDGVGIGLAFQVSTPVGFSVALAVIAHDFCDGLNTVGVMLRHRHPFGRSMAMLLFDAAAPVVGAASTLAFHLPDSAMVIYLGLFAGFLLHLSLGDLLPAAHATAPSSPIKLVSLTAAGASCMFAIVLVAQQVAR